MLPRSAFDESIQNLTSLDPINLEFHLNKVGIKHLNDLNLTFNQWGSFLSNLPKNTYTAWVEQFLTLDSFKKTHQEAFSNIYFFHHFISKSPLPWSPPFKDFVRSVIEGYAQLRSENQNREQPPVSQDGDEFSMPSDDESLLVHLLSRFNFLTWYPTIRTTQYQDLKMACLEAFGSKNVGSHIKDASELGKILALLPGQEKAFLKLIGLMPNDEQKSKPLHLQTKEVTKIVEDSLKPRKSHYVFFTDSETAAIFHAHEHPHHRRSGLR